MKNLILILTFLLTNIVSAAHFSVTDAVHIKTTLATSKRELLELITQGLNQAEELQGLYSQIGQIDDFLHRLGKLEDVRDLPGFDAAAEAFVHRLELNLPSIDILKDLDLEELFKQDETSPYTKIDKDIIVDGEKVAEVEAAALREQLAFRKTAEQYRNIRALVLTRRSMLKGELEETMVLLREATTKAQVDKLTALVSALSAQIAANDQELAFASQEVTARYHQNKIEQEIKQEVQQQKDVASFKTGLRKSLQIFTPPSTPALFEPRNK
ncbi:hypothetical protein N9891_00125 [bacterium]|nr:hypothetical protein [bacterium]